MRDASRRGPLMMQASCKSLAFSCVCFSESTLGKASAGWYSNSLTVIGACIPRTMSRACRAEPPLPHAAKWSARCQWQRLSNLTDHNGFTWRSFDFPSNRRCEQYRVLLFGNLFLVSAVEMGHTSAGNELPRVEDPNHERILYLGEV